MKKNKGFTLVEIIVILVILAILSAVLIPSLTTYIDKAREKNIAADAHSAYVASQALISEGYGLQYDWEEIASADDLTGTYSAANILALAQLNTDRAQITNIVTADGAQITTFEFQETINGSTYTASWDRATGTWEISR